MLKLCIEKRTIIFCFLTFFVVMSYSNSFHASWHLDDFHNIVLNEKIHIQKIDLSSIYHSLYASENGKLYRPMPMLSFALNWYFNGIDVFGYHIVNIAIHCINSFLLYLLISALLKLTIFNNRYTISDINTISLMATLFWALNPVQTQAITYIVQRMASMAAMFFLFSLYIYILAKRESAGWKRILLIAISITSYILATLSKENVVLWPISILLIEVVFYDLFQSKRFIKEPKFIFIISICTLFTITLILFLFEWKNPYELLSTFYEQRTFTPLQRLMTESRILLFYLSLLFFPLPSRLSLCHDIELSTSLISPITTIISVLFIFCLIIYCCTVYKRYKFLSFSILFFFINHIVESTILPLELVFEHRNYLPSAFIFLPLAVWMHKIKVKLSKKNRKYNTLVLACFWMIIGILGNWTFSRNFVWSDEKIFWEYEISKNPALSRPYHNLAWGHYQASGNYEEAVTLYKKSLSLKANSKIERSRTMNNLGRVYYLLGDYKNALSSFDTAIKVGQNIPIAEYQKAMTLIQLGRWQEASDSIDHLVTINYTHLDINRLKGVVKTHQGETATAIRFFEMSLKNDPLSVDTTVHLSTALARISFFDRASALLLSTGDDADSLKPIVLIGLADISRHKGDQATMQRYLNRFLAEQDRLEMINLLVKWARDKTMPLIDYAYYVKLINK